MKYRLQIVIIFTILFAETGVIRLMDGETIFEGRVEIYYETAFGGSWGAVCDDGWDEDDAKVVCQQLGYGPVISAHR